MQSVVDFERILYKKRKQENIAAYNSFIHPLDKMMSSGCFSRLQIIILLKVRYYLAVINRNEGK